jgi:hypothetical protein
MYKLYLTCGGVHSDRDPQREQQMTAHLLTARMSLPDIVVGSIAVLEQQRGPGYCEPVVTVSYDVQAGAATVGGPQVNRHQQLVQAVDSALRFIAQQAVSALVTQVVDYAVHGVLAGAAAGLAGGGGTAARQQDMSPGEQVGLTLAVGLLGGLIGGAVGSSITREIPVLSGSKDQFGQWLFSNPAGGPPVPAEA